MWYFSPNLFWWYHTFQPWENVLTFFCIVMFKICQFLRALIHNVTTAFIRSTHFKNFFFLRTYPVFHSITMWRMTASIFLKIYSIVDANRWIPLCTKITKKKETLWSCSTHKVLQHHKILSNSADKQQSFIDITHLTDIVSFQCRTWFSSK